MLWAGTEVGDLFVGVTVSGLRHADGSVDWDADNDVVRLLARKKLGQANARRRSIRVWVSGSLARPFLLGPVAGLRNRGEAVALARAQASEATGLAGPFDVTVEGQLHAEAALATAMSSGRVTWIEETVKQTGARLLSLRPWWALAIDQALAEGKSFELAAVRDADALTVIGANDAGWTTAASYVPAPTAEPAEAMLSRRVIAAGVEEGRVLRLQLSRDAVGISSAWPRAEALETF